MVVGWRRQRYLKPALLSGVSPGRANKGLWHGVTLISGPTGGGKTALAIMLIYNMAMKPQFQCKGRSCNNSKCTTKWEIYTNSTKLTGRAWERNGASVIHPIDEILPMLQAKKKVDHVIFFVDEVQEWIDSRQSMKKDNKEVSYIIAQMRKLTCKTYMTTPNINAIDRRVRDMAKRTFTCWNPDGKATNVRTLIRELNVGHLAPWERDNIRDAYREYFTEPYKHFYDTHEQLSPPSFFTPNETVRIKTINQHGEPQIIKTTYKSIIEDSIIENMMLDNNMKPTAEELLAALNEEFHIVWDIGKLATSMKHIGYNQQEDGSYHLGVDNTPTYDVDY